MVSAQSFDDLAAAADHVSGVSALKMDQENAALDAGKQHLPPEDQNLRKLSASDSDKVAVPAEQPEEERPPREHAPRPQRRAPRGPKHLLAEKPRVRPAAKRVRARTMSVLAPLLLRPLLLLPSTSRCLMPPPATSPPSTVPWSPLHPLQSIPPTTTLLWSPTQSLSSRCGQRQRRPLHRRLRRHCVRRRRSGRRHLLH